ncbi:hypothetical protein [Burkholderia ubonensis]|uniref:hypothetical protein n=1 Tax=Burkholderia ubonensis TaxID=101571 RepID=UPI000A8F9F42|nr:hypothetical protein [Burkholderia ubonensis]
MNILDRLNEPSTHAGIGVFATAAASVAVQLGANPSKVGLATTLLQGFFGLLAIFAPEKAGS